MGSYNKAWLADTAERVIRSIAWGLLAMGSVDAVANAVNNGQFATIKYGLIFTAVSSSYTLLGCVVAAQVGAGGTASFLKVLVPALPPEPPAPPPAAAQPAP